MARACASERRVGSCSSRSRSAPVEVLTEKLAARGTSVFWKERSPSTRTPVAASAP